MDENWGPILGRGQVSRLNFGTGVGVGFHDQSRGWVSRRVLGFIFEVGVGLRDNGRGRVLGRRLGLGFEIRVRIEFRNGG